MAGGLSVTIGFFAVGGILQKFIYSGWAWRSFEVVFFFFLRLKGYLRMAFVQLILGKTFFLHFFFF